MWPLFAMSPQPAYQGSSACVASLLCSLSCLACDDTPTLQAGPHCRQDCIAHLTCRSMPICALPWQAQLTPHQCKTQQQHSLL
jgi:hypothetical protein